MRSAPFAHSTPAVAPEAPILARARALLVEAENTALPAERFRAAHLAALRCTAAVFAASRPGRGVTRRPVNAWVLLAQVAPELSDWARLFAAGASKRAAVEAGLDSAVDARDADEQLAAAQDFLGLVERRLGVLDVALAG